jgi:regulator of protease activity HflC (stomatin/prohibitin superfamily)
MPRIVIASLLRSREEMCVEDKRFCAMVVGGIVGFITVLLILILVPLHFSYIDRQHIGFKKNTVTNNVDKGTVYNSGTHAWGVGKTAIQFPSMWQHVDFSGKSALSFFTDAGEIEVELSFYYRIQAERLAKLYSDFGLAYHNRIVSIAQAELRNAATNFTTRHYQEERMTVAQGLYDNLAATLPSKASVEVNRQFFFLEHIHLPQSVLNKRLQVFTNTQLQITQDYNRTASQSRLDTLANETVLSNSADIIRKNATESASRLRAAARAKAFALVQKESGEQLRSMRTLLNITAPNVTDALVKFNKLLDTSNVTLLHGIRTSFLQRP